MRDALSSLDAALEGAGMTLADQMAWRSECAPGWWALVAPAPAGIETQPPIPHLDPAKSFWETGCAPHCRQGAAQAPLNSG